MRHTYFWRIIIKLDLVKIYVGYIFIEYNSAVKYRRIKREVMEFFTLASSSSGNCAFAKSGDTAILIDAGIAAAKIEQTLAEQGERPDKIAAILLTHEHTDHIAGAARLAVRYGIPVYASPKTWSALPFAAALPPSLKREFTYDMRLGEFSFEFCKTSHDAVQPVGLVVQAEGKRLGYVTDTGTVTRGMLYALHDLDALVLEANHDRQMLMQGPYAPFLKRRVAGLSGHLANSQAAELLARLLQKRLCPVMLAHLSETNNTPQTAYQAILPVLQRLGGGAEKWLAVAPAHAPSVRWTL